jgi:hypothetical protein
VDEASVMGMSKCRGDLPGHRNRLWLVETLLGDDAVVDRLAVDVLHHEVVVFPRIPDVVGGHDVGVVESRRGATFLLEPSDEIGVVAVAAGQHLDRHVTIERQLAGEEDRGHRAGAQFSHDPVAGDPLGAAFGLDLGSDPIHLGGGDESGVEQLIGEAGARIALTLVDRLLEFRVAHQASFDHDASQHGVEPTSGAAATDGRLFTGSGGGWGVGGLFGQRFFSGRNAIGTGYSVSASTIVSSGFPIGGTIRPDWAGGSRSRTRSGPGRAVRMTIQVFS